MRVIWRLAGLSLAVAACSSSGNDAEPVNTSQSENESAPAPPANLEADPVNLSAGEPLAQRLPCPDTPGTMCSGPLIVRGENFNLMREGSSIHTQGIIVFENRTEGPVRFAMLDERIAVALDDGQTLATTNDSFSGLTLCPRDGADCYERTPEYFQTLNPGDSPARLSAGFRGNELSSLRAANPSVASATITFQVYVVDAANVGSTLSISLVNVPLRNQISR